HHLGVLRKQLHALDVPPVLARQPDHRSVAAPEVQHAAYRLRMSLDEGVRLAMSAVLPRRGPWIDAREDVFLLIYADDARVAHDQPAISAAIVVNVPAIALGVEQPQVPRAAQLACHLSIDAAARHLHSAHALDPSRPADERR